MIALYRIFTEKLEPEKAYQESAKFCTSSLDEPNICQIIIENLNKTIH